MADATVTQARRDEPLAVAAEPALGAAPWTATTVALPIVLLWAAFVTGVTAFLVFGTVRVGAGNWFGWRMSVRQVWSRFIRFLSDEGAASGVILAVTGAAVVTLIGCAVVLWLAFTLKDEGSDPAADDLSRR